MNTEITFEIDFTKTKVYVTGINAMLIQHKYINPNK